MTKGAHLGSHYDQGSTSRVTLWLRSTLDRARPILDDTKSRWNLISILGKKCYQFMYMFPKVSDCFPKQSRIERIHTRTPWGRAGGMLTRTKKPEVAKIHCSSFSIHIPKWPNIIAPGFEKLSIALGFPLHSPAYLQRGQRGRGKKESCNRQPDRKGRYEVSRACLAVRIRHEWEKGLKAV